MVMVKPRIGDIVKIRDASGFRRAEFPHRSILVEVIQPPCITDGNKFYAKPFNEPALNVIYWYKLEEIVPREAPPVRIKGKFIGERCIQW